MYVVGIGMRIVTQQPLKTCDPPVFVVMAVTPVPVVELQLLAPELVVPLAAV